MPLQDYLKAKKIIAKNEELSDFEEGCEVALIKLAEKKLGIEFSGAYYEFLKDFGVGSFGSIEIFGIIDEDFENSSVPDGVWYTLTERKQSGLSENYFVIGEMDEGGLICLDFSNLINNEPSVKFISSNKVDDYAEDFGKYLLEIVTTQLE
jgi:hypothetical protein